MKSVPDVNVLLPLILSDHPHRSVASAWWDACPDDSVLLTLPVRMAVLRLLTNRALMRDGVLSPDAAWGTLQAFVEDARVDGVVDIPPGTDALWFAFVRGRATSPNVWTDAWLAAYAEARGCELVTFDRGFRQFGVSHLKLLAPAEA